MSGKMLNRDLRLTGGAELYVNEVRVIDADGNIDAPVTASSLTTAGALSVGTTSTLTGAVAAAGSITLGAGADLIGSSTSDITINTNKFTVAGATGNTVIAGTHAAGGSITLGAGADLIGSATSDITINTNKFTVAGATGNTLVAGTLDVTGATGLTGKLTADDVDLASGAVVAGLGTGANGVVLKNLKNAAASGLSGTQLDIEIDIAGTPYYFTVYPTKA